MTFYTQNWNNSFRKDQQWKSYFICRPKWISIRIFHMYCPTLVIFGLTSYNALLRWWDSRKSLAERDSTFLMGLNEITIMSAPWNSVTFLRQRTPCYNLRRVQLKCDGTRWRTGGEWRGNWRMEWVASTLYTTSEHGVSNITTAGARTWTASSRLNWRPRRFKWTRPFRRKTKSGLFACAITFQTQSTTVGHGVGLRDL
jgi:hypothetical protein